MEQRRTLRLILYVFLLTFIVARVVVFLIMDHLMPDMYFHVAGTHVHHLNYGIFLLSASGGFVLVKRPSGRELDFWIVAYAIGLALTFDEFGMWLHLGGPYWQRASFDAVVMISGLLALLVCVAAGLTRVNVFEIMFHRYDKPAFTAVSEAKVDGDDKVLAILVGGAARAYPIRSIAYHHIINDEVGGRAVVATY